MQRGIVNEDICAQAAKKICSRSVFGEQQNAYKYSFVDPYIGKYYGGRCSITEVVSMGMPDYSGDRPEPPEPVDGEDPPLAGEVKAAPPKPRKLNGDPQNEANF